MLTSRDGEFAERIGSILLDVLPEGATSITVECEADDDYASASFEFVNGDGSRGHFTMHTNPEDAAAGINRVVNDWWNATNADGQEKWYGLTMTVDRDGNVEVNFSRDPIEDSEPDRAGAPPEAHGANEIEAEPMNPTDRRKPPLVEQRIDEAPGAHGFIIGGSIRPGENR